MDGNGNRRSNLDKNAQYTITYAGGSTTVTVDQNQTNVIGNDVWVNLGVYSFNGPATVRSRAATPTRTIGRSPTR